MYKDSAPNPIDLFSAALHLGSDGQLRTGPPRFAEGDHWQVACFRVVATDAEVHADHWEVHPAGEEAVCCVTGAFRVHLRAAAPDGTDSVVRLRAGEAIVVPRGVWHRVELEEPGAVVSVGVRRGSQLEQVTASHEDE
jgi:mannose-6-phosphate isomerase-like protein (cupin superfamily)